MSSVASRLQHVLWPPGASSRVDVYAILDGARDDLVHAFVQASYLEKSCLYAGDLPQELSVTAPWLVKLEQDNQWTNRILNRAWSNSWGVFVRVETSTRELRNHLRRFLRVRDDRGRVLVFRYYDPRVLRVYLPTCTPGELKTFFGPIQQLLMEDADGSGVLQFSLDAMQLRQNRIPLKDEQHTDRLRAASALS